MSPSAKGEDEQPTTLYEGSPLEAASAEVTKASAPAVIEPVSPTADGKAEQPLPLADAGEYYVGLWANKVPLYGCPYCPYTSTEGSNNIAWHIDEKARTGSKAHSAAFETGK